MVVRPGPAAIGSRARQSCWAHTRAIVQHGAHVVPQPRHPHSGCSHQQRGVLGTERLCNRAAAAVRPDDVKSGAVLLFHLRADRRAFTRAHCNEIGTQSVNGEMVIRAFATASLAGAENFAPISRRTSWRPTSRAPWLRVPSGRRPASLPRFTQIAAISHYDHVVAVLTHGEKVDPG